MPENVIVKAPTAELRENQKDQDSLPPYDMLDAILEGLVEREDPVAQIVAKGFDRDIVLKVARLLDIAEYKRRQAAPGVKVTCCSCAGPAGLVQHRILQIARDAFEHVVVERLLAKHLLELHHALAHGAGRFLNLRHDSSLSENADRLGFLLWLGRPVNARARSRVPRAVELNFCGKTELRKFRLEMIGCGP
jgi:hypothetical protein